MPTHMTLFKSPE